MNGFQENVKLEFVRNAKALIGIDIGDHKQHKEIKLTQGKFALVDDEDFEWLNQWKWHVIKGKSGMLYAERSIRNNGKRINFLMHREIIKTPKGMNTDHENRNGLDNRRDNLRYCTKSQNAMNTEKNKDNKSGYKGVGWHKLSQKWRARITVKGKEKYLGLFDAPQEAAIIYNKKAIELFGEFARLNIIK